MKYHDFVNHKIKYMSLVVMVSRITLPFTRYLEFKAHTEILFKCQREWSFTD